MGEYKLKHDITSILKDGRTTYGGSQKLSENKTIRSSGCGPVAACDLFLYMHRHHEYCNSNLFASLPSSGPIDIKSYDNLLSSLSFYFPLIPNYGISGFMLTLGINSFFIRHSFPYIAVWGIRADIMWERIEKMLSQDIPVIISVGPNLSLSRHKYKTDMYSLDRHGQLKRSAKVNAHFMTVTAIDDQWLTLSSWGRKYFISRSDYRIYSKHHSGSLFSNIVYITRK